MKKTLLSGVMILLTMGTVFSQSSIELLGAAGTGGPAGIGPTTANQTVTFHTTAATAFSPAVTATYSLSNQQFTSIEGNSGTAASQMGGNIVSGTNTPVPGSNIYDLMNALSGSVNTNYTSCNSCAAGSGIDVTANRSIEITNYTDALINSAGTQLFALNARVQYADITITFNRPVSNPVLHVTGLGGQVSYSTTIAGVTTNYDMGFTTDMDLLTPGLTLSKLSGNTQLTVTSTSLSNNATRLGAATAGALLHNVNRFAATGSVVILGTNITTVSFRMYIRGDGGIVVNNAGVVVPATNGNIVRWALHGGFIPGGGTTVLQSIAGDGFLIGLSLQQPVTVSGNLFNDPDAGNVNNSTGGSNVVPSGFNANLIDANGNVLATTPINTDGSYSFPAIFEGTYSMNISATSGTQGSAAPAAGAPAGWSNTGEFNGTPNTGTDGSVNGTSATFAVTTTNVGNINLAIQRLPESAVNLQPAQVNPAGFGTIPIPAGAFQTNNVGVTPNTSDYDGGTIGSILITAFPANTNTITINGTTYINGGSCPPAVTCTPWPGGGVTVPYTNGTGIAVPIAVDPVDGAVSVVIPFAAIDNAGGQDATPGSVTIPVTQPVTIGDRVWKDDDGDGVQDAGEVGVAGITVTLYDNGGNAVASTVTDAYGNYQFTNVYAASGGTTYSVGFTPPANYSFSPQTGGGGAGNAVDSDPNPSTGRTAAFTVNPGDVENDIDAGLLYAQPALPASVGDKVWSDLDGDGTQDANEPGMAGVTVTLFDGAGNVVGSTITDASGNYVFNNLPAGNYQVGFTAPAGFVFSNKDQGGDDNTDSDVNTSGINFGRTDIFALTSGEQRTNTDAGLVADQTRSSVGDKVWNDLDQDGVQDTGEPGIAGVQVQLYTTGPDGIAGNGDDVLVTTTVTDAAGNYMFTGVTPGAYYIKFTTPSGYSLSPQDAGGNDNTDSDINISGNTASFAVAAGSPVVDTRWDAGFYQTAPAGTSTLGDKVWNDIDGDGVQDAGEPGVAGVAAILYNSGGTPVDTVYTDVNGEYKFVNLAAANYSVGFANLPAGYTYTGQDTGGNDNADSDANPATGRTGTIAVPAATNITNVDAGIRQGTPAGTGTVGNRVWYDLDSDGLQDAGELGVNGVTVTLRDAGPDGVFGNGDDIIRTTTTNPLGDFSFTGLPAGNYRVEYSNLPAGFGTSPQNTGTDDGIDSDGAAPVAGVSVTPSFNLATGQDKLDVALGLTAPANTNTIGDRFWIDTDNDGIQDGTETSGLPGVTVTLYNAAGAAVATTGTDANGNYLFAGLPDGTYTVGFSNLPAGYSLTGKDLGGNDNADSDADLFSSRTGGITVNAGNRNVTNVDAGAFSTRAAVGDRVWNDLDGDGIQDPGEPGIAGVTVILYDNTSTPVASMVTDENGNYLFANVIPGTYTIGFASLPAGLGYTGKELTPGGTGSDVNISTGRTDAITLNAGDYRTDIDAGLRPPFTATIGDFVWYDLDGNGVQDAGEPGVGGVLVTLYGPGPDGIPNNGDDVAIGAAVTAGNGKYLMTNVPAGTNYYLTFGNKPLGSTYTLQNIGGGAAADNSKVDPAGVTATFNVGWGQVLSNLDAGIVGVRLLPVKLESFTAVRSGNTALLQWNVSAEENLNSYILQRSTDQVNYTDIGVVSASGRNQYTYTDTDPVKGINHYRLKMVERNGAAQYSPVRILRFGKEELITLYPNPAKEKITLVVPAGWTGKKMSLELITVNGQVVLQKQYSSILQTETISFAQLTPGAYLIRLTDSEANVYIRKIQITQ